MFTAAAFPVLNDTSRTETRISSPENRPINLKVTVKVIIIYTIYLTLQKYWNLVLIPSSVPPSPSVLLFLARTTSGSRSMKCLDFN